MYPDFLNMSAEEVAPQLLGCLLTRQFGDRTATVRIVETEAYDQSDEASHAYRGMTDRNKVMFGASGHLYVYFTYGMHYCCNIVAGEAGYGSGVLIRAAEPIGGLDIIEKRRGLSGVQTTNGPAKLCQALGIDFDLRGHDLRQPPLRLLIGTLAPEEHVGTSPRIGTSRARGLQRRFFIVGNSYVSR